MNPANIGDFNFELWILILLAERVVLMFHIWFI